MPISSNVEDQSKTRDKSQGPEPNQWITNGNLGSKEALLVFSTSLLATTQNSFSQESVGPSTSSTCPNLAAKASAEPETDLLQSNTLPKNSHRLSFRESISKKRHLESSSSLTSLDQKSKEKPEEEENDKENVDGESEGSEMPAALYNISYKFVNTETRLLRKILNAHGLQEATQDEPFFNIVWTGNPIKPDMLRNLTPYQRINHFPRSSELTRKDRLYKNIEKMQQYRGLKHFDFVPQTFLLPADFKELVSTHIKSKGPWIVKPVASSRGRGIFLAKTPEEIQANIASDEQVVVARYIDNPLLIGGHKCDIRIYVAVTSFDPLIIYVYEEGLVRLATVKYEKSVESLWNPCIHLTNYSINKYHTDYMRSNGDDENYGHKWSLSALLRHLKNTEGCNTEQLMLNIEDLIIKAILACSQPITSACRMFVSHVTNCFELFGFDVLMDDNLKPWLIEVNLSPSLGVDSPLDAKVKASLLTDLLNLVGVPVVNPKPAGNSFSQSRPWSAGRRVNSSDSLGAGKRSSSTNLTAEESRIVRAAKGQFGRRGGFVRIFPAFDSMQKYGMFLDSTTGIPTAVSDSSGSYLMIIPHNYNQMLFQQLFGGATYEDNDVEERMMKYERALEQSLPIVFSPKPSQSTNHDEVKRMKLEIRKSIENGDELSVLQARRAFSTYLELVLKRLIGEPKRSHEEYLIKFLHRIAIYMRQPFFIRNVDHNKILSKERGAMVAKLLGDFLHMYNKESEAYVGEFERVGIISTQLFDEFLVNAQELDVESVLTLHTNVTQQMPFLYNSCNCPNVPLIPVGSHGFLKSLPYMAPGSHMKEVSRSEANKPEKPPIKVTKSPAKKKVPVIKNKDRDRSAWLFQ